MIRLLDGGTTWAIILLLISSAALVGYLAFQKPAPQPPAVVSVTPDVTEFGTVGQGEFRVAEFRVANNLSEPIELLEVKTSCSCTKFDLEPKHVPPGESGRVKLNWSSSNRRGEVDLSALLIVKFPDDRNVVFPLNIHASVEPDILISPPDLSFTVDKPEVRRVTLAPGRLSEFQVKAAYSSHSSIIVHSVPGDPRSFDITFRPVQGGLPPFLTVDFVTDSRNEPTLSVPVVVTGATPSPIPSLMTGEK